MAPPDGFLGGVIGPGLMEMLQKMIGAEEEDLVARAAGRVPQRSLSMRMRQSVSEFSVGPPC
jgi:hypothetical protein